MKDKILEHIREVCNLKKLEFGCEVKCEKFTYQKFSVLYIQDRDLYLKPFGEYKDGEFIDKSLYLKVSDIDVDITKVDIKHIDEIIGLPVELNHLLFSLPRTAECLMGIDSGVAVLRVDSYVIEYDLTKSVPENLNNPDVCLLVGELLGIEE